MNHDLRSAIVQARFGAQISRADQYRLAGGGGRRGREKNMPKGTKVWLPLGLAGAALMVLLPLGILTGL